MKHAVSAVMVLCDRNTTAYTVQFASGRTITKRYLHHSHRLDHYDRIRALANRSGYRMRATVAWPGFSVMRKTD